jgi:hypothetical protein
MKRHTSPVTGREEFQCKVLFNQSNVLCTNMGEEHSENSWMANVGIVPSCRYGETVQRRN